MLRTKWNFSEEQVAFLVNDVKSMRVVTKEEKKKKDNQSRTFKALRMVIKRKKNSRWAADVERERFALFLNANRGGTSVTNQLGLTDDVDDYGLSETYFVGCSVDYYQYGEGSPGEGPRCFS